MRAKRQQVKARGTAIQQALAAFAAQSPAMVVDSVTLRINESLLVPAEQPVSGLLTVSVLKVGA